MQMLTMADLLAMPATESIEIAATSSFHGSF